MTQADRVHSTPPANTSANNPPDQPMTHDDELGMALWDRSGAMADEVNAICWKLANTQPTTLAGVAAVLRFANEVEDAGLEWPDTDTIGSEGWHYQLRATMAAAIENSGWEGGAVMRTTSKTPRLRIVAGTAYAPTETGIPASTTPRLIGLSSNTKLTSHFDDRPSTGSLSTTAENGRLREKRYEAWREAEAATRYWRARLDFHDALSSVQRRAMSEGRSHPAADDEDRQALVNGWRAAFVRQLLTPAPLAAYGSKRR